MNGMLNSTILKLNAEYLEKVKAYCIEHELRMTIRERDNKDLPYYVLVWGTKRELNEFGQYF